LTAAILLDWEQALVLAWMLVVGSSVEEVETGSIGNCPEAKRGR